MVKKSLKSTSLIDAQHLGGGKSINTSKRGITRKDLYLFETSHYVINLCDQTQ